MDVGGGSGARRGLLGRPGSIGGGPGSTGPPHPPPAAPPPDNRPLTTNLGQAPPPPGRRQSEPGPPANPRRYRDPPCTNCAVARFPRASLPIGTEGGAVALATAERLAIRNAASWRSLSSTANQRGGVGERGRCCRCSAGREAAGAARPGAAVGRPWHLHL